MRINLQDQVTSVADVYITEINQSAVALNLNNEIYYGLNQEAFKMYQVLIGSKDVGSALENLASEFTVSKTELETDLMQLLNELLNNGLVKIKSNYIE